MPLVAILAPGEITIKNNAEEHLLVTDGGIVEVADNLVKILADAAESAENLDEMKIMEAKYAAEVRLSKAKDEVEFADATAHLEKQIVMAKIAAKRKRPKA